MSSPRATARRSRSSATRTRRRPDPPARRLNATDASFDPNRRPSITPLLSERGDVVLLVAGGGSELLVTGDRITRLPAFEARRYTYRDVGAAAGLALAGDRAMVLGEHRRRVTIEQHGPSAPPPALLVGADGDSRRRPMTLGRRDDGAAAILVFDGGAGVNAGAAAIDRVTGAVLPATPLAPWSSVATADDPRCAERGAYRALVVIDPSQWHALGGPLAGVTPARKGLAKVRWGRERACLEALDIVVTDARRRGATTRAWSLVARWGGKGRGGDEAALRANDVVQGLVCSVEAAKRE